MLLLGSTPEGRKIEQHDMFFGIAQNLRDLVPAIIESWPEAKGNIHIDAWREVNYVDGYAVRILERNGRHFPVAENNVKLFFLNLGGYKQNEFEEYHYKMLVACESKSTAIQRAKETAFYKHVGFKGAASHIDDKYGVDVDDIFEIADILPAHVKENFTIVLSPAPDDKEDEMNLGYFILRKL